MTQPRSFKTAIAGVGAAALLTSAAQAGDYGKAVIDDKNPVVPEDPWSYCDLFDIGKLYKSDTGLIRSFSVGGRYQGQYFSQTEDISGQDDNSFNEFQHRRARLGAKLGLAHGFTIFAEANIADGENFSEGPFFNNFQDAYIEWEPTDSWFIRVGKQKQEFTIEDSTSSKRIKTVERSSIVNETAGARPYGAVFGLETGPVSHQIGAWLYGGEANSIQWVDFDSNAGASYNMAFGIHESTDLMFDYVYADNAGGAEGSEGSAATGFGPAYEHSFSLGTKTEMGKFQIIANGIVAVNRTGSGGIPAGNDTWGAYILPSYELTDKLELVFRYAYMDEGREQRPQRFPVRLPVENYHTFYAGLQYKFCGDALKVMAGYEYATGDVFESDSDIDTGSWQFAVRTYF